MPNLLSSLNTGRAINAELEQLLEAAVARLQAGEHVDLTELAAAHPEHAEEIRQLLPAIEMLVGMGAAGADVTAEIGSHLHAADATTTAAPPPFRQLGDFRIIRELGRGGMGTVFEAEQLSMGRRVALKVLPFAALAHEKSLQRFRNEVRAAAALDHPHIVSVYSVGEERGVNYFAMQLIRGQSLAEVILQQRRVHDPLPPASRGVPAPGSPDSPAASGNEDPTIDSAISAPSTAPIEQARVSTARDSKFAAERFRAAARLGIQAAEALQHAHDQGVLHRDIKPGNLLVDADGKLYVTDFGLARIQSDAGMTMTGDIVGTLRYMAPEQALAKRVVIDHRADVYSLGATLYELLTLQPAFGETDRSELLKQIAFEDPKPLRKTDRRIPIDLETIVLKALAKNPDDRLQTAQALADDLRCFLDNKPIKAKPPTWRDRAAMWSRRHVGFVWAAAAVLCACIVTLAAANSRTTRLYREAERQRQIARDQERAAVAQRKIAKRNEYYAVISSGQYELSRANMGRLHDKLVDQLPLVDEADRRGWEWYFLYTSCHGEERRFRKSGQSVDAAWSPDGQLIAVDNAIWESQTGRCLRILPTDNPTMFVSWSADSAKLAIPDVNVGDGGIVHVWDRQTNEINSWVAHDNSAWCAAWSPDGEFLATGSIDLKVKIWDVAKREMIRSFDAGQNVTDLVWDPTGSSIAAGICYTGVKLWDVDDRKLIAESTDRGRGRTWVRLSWQPGGQWLAVATPEEWYLYDPTTGEVKSQHSDPLLRIRDIDWKPDGSAVAVAQGETVTVWRPDGERPERTFTGHLRPVNSVSWAPDGRQLVSADAEEDCRIWNLDRPLTVREVDCGDELQSLAWTLDDRALTAVTVAGERRLQWDTLSAAPSSSAPPVSAPAVNWSPRYNYVATSVGGDKTSISVFDAHTGRLVARWMGAAGRTLLDLTWSPDESKIAIETRRRRINSLEFWSLDAPAKNPRWSIEMPWYRKLTSVCWSPDSQRIAVAAQGDALNGYRSNVPHVHVIDVRSGDRMWQYRHFLANNEFTSMCMAWRSDGRRLTFGDGEGKLIILEGATGRVVNASKAHRAEIQAVSWHPDGRRIASAAVDGGVSITSARDGENLLGLQFDEGAANLLAWSADGQRLAAATKTGLLRVWDASSAYRTHDLPRGEAQRSELAWDYYRRAAPSGIIGPIDRDAMRRFLQVAPTTIDFTVARAFAHLFLGLGNQAIDELQKASHARRDPALFNLFSWVMAASPNDEDRNGAAAVRSAIIACDLTAYRDPNILDTLAAAHAENGDFAAAIAWAKKTLDLLPPNDALRSVVQSHLDRFTQGNPWREPLR